MSLNSEDFPKTRAPPACPNSTRKLCRILVDAFALTQASPLNRRDATIGQDRSHGLSKACMPGWHRSGDSAHRSSSREISRATLIAKKILILLPPYAERNYSCVLKNKYFKTKPVLRLPSRLLRVCRFRQHGSPGWRFNDWKHTPMKRSKIYLRPDCDYEFRYLLDGVTWENDLQADRYVPNVYGSENSAVAV